MDDFVHSGPLRGSDGMMATRVPVCPGSNGQGNIGIVAIEAFIPCILVVAIAR